MQTIYDWVTLAVFAGLIVLFLQRSIGDAEPQDTIFHYLPPAAGCAGANYLGNEGYDLPAILVIVAVLAYTHYVLHPFNRRPG